MESINVVIDDETSSTSSEGEHIIHNEESMEKQSAEKDQVKLLTPNQAERSTPPPQEELSIVNLLNLPKEPSSRVKLNHQQENVLGDHHWHKMNLQKQVG